MLFHYLIDKRPADFVKFQARIARLTPWRIAWKDSFPDLSDDKLDQELHDYWNGGMFNGTERELTIVVGQVDARPLSDAEVHSLRAYLYAIGGPPKAARVNEEIAEAVSQDRGNVEASAVAFYRPNVPDAEKKALAAEARTRHPSDWLAASMAADGGGEAARIRSFLLVALARTPQQPELLVRLALAEAATGRWEQALSFSTAALRLGAADNQGLLVVHTEALARTGKCADASFFVEALAHRFGPKQATRLDAARAALANCIEAPSTPPTEPP